MAFKVIQFNPENAIEDITEQLQGLEALLNDGYELVFTQWFMTTRATPRIFAFLRKPEVQS